MNFRPFCLIPLLLLACSSESSEPSGAAGSAGSAGASGSAGKAGSGGSSAGASGQAGGGQAGSGQAGGGQAGSGQAGSGPAGYGKQCTGSTDDELMAWSNINEIRVTAGLAPIDCDDALQKAARAHADYCKQNGCGDAHGETPGKPGYTGSSPGERAAAAGYTGSFYLEAAGPFVALINSVYHRLPFLAFVSKHYGYSSSYYDFGSGGDTPGLKLVTWPPDGSTKVPLGFLHIAEGPDPLPSVSDPEVGSPVSLHARGALVINSATLEGPSGVVDSYVITAANDSTGFIQNAVFLLAKKPLSDGASYKTTFSGTIDGEPFEKQVNFVGCGSCPSY